jgi:Patatin-like phospholipase
MTDGRERGDHAYVDTNDKDQIHKDASLAKSVFDAEIEAIDRRRKNIKTRNRAGCQRTGLALSGGGIRSASFGLGALQALQAKHENHPNIYGIEGIDYLSTVSGGGYIGCSLTAAMQKTKGIFPFTNPENYDDTDSVRHIRDYSNYLIPHGALDVVTALGIIGRGLVANAIIIAPILLFFVWFTLVTHPTVASLSEPTFFVWDFRGLIHKLGLQELHGFWFTAILAVVNVIFLVFWAFFGSIYASQFWQNELRSRGNWQEYGAALRGPLVFVWQLLFFITLISAWFETQPFILNAMVTTTARECDVSALWYGGISVACFGKILHGWLEYLTPWLAPFGALFAFLSKYLADVIALTKSDARWRPWIKKILAMAALWSSAIVIPSFLWLLYLWLTKIGLSKDQDYPFAPAWLRAVADWDWLRAVTGWLRAAADWLGALAPHAMVGWLQGFDQHTGATRAALLYFVAFGVTLLLALWINPNATSLYRLYRDRLSKAFLFDPDPNPEERDKKYFDLPQYELYLHEIDTNYCPYPIINASLNIEHSQYANKRGRNADFFIFTPEYTGSGATGYIGTQRIEKDETALDLGTAMAISAAAVSSNMGALTIKPLTFTLALLNVRLGYWLRNPRGIDVKRPWYRTVRRLFDIRSVLLFKEAFGWITEKSPKVLLTDGGHIENLGVYSLLKRRCKVIIAIDAIADPAMGFGAFLTLERYARIDLGATIDLPWRAIRDCNLAVDKAFGKADEDGSAIPSSPGPHCAAGDIQYGPNGPNKDEKGILFYVKASLSGDENDYILDYKRRNRAFPHETTSDQFFGEEQLEAYRALGFHIMKGLLTGEISFAVAPDPKEPEDKKRTRILREVRAALFGTAPKP